MCQVLNIPINVSNRNFLLHLPFRSIQPELHFEVIKRRSSWTLVTMADNKYAFNSRWAGQPIRGLVSLIRYVCRCKNMKAKLLLSNTPRTKNAINKQQKNYQMWNSTHVCLGSWRPWSPRRGELGPGQLGPGQLGPGELGPGAQLYAFGEGHYQYW